MSVKLLTEHHLKFLSLKGGCIGVSESTLRRFSAIVFYLPSLKILASLIFMPIYHRPLNHTRRLKYIHIV